MSLGGAGAFRITPAVAEVLVNNLALNYSLSEAIENARVYYSFTTGLTEIEGTLVLFWFGFYLAAP